uniref:Uncharacterized protein n=1 Tax=Leptospira ellisii TaxID=2023197 RepID=A0A2N0B6L7_9LEPT|nr:hypothetical protein CH379_14620 [Leptospira ellisii]
MSPSSFRSKSRRIRRESFSNLAYLKVVHNPLFLSYISHTAKSQLQSVSSQRPRSGDFHGSCKK